MKECQIISMPPITIPPPFARRFLKIGENAKFKKFLDKFNNLSINISLIEALQNMSGYAKFMKELVSKKWLVGDETIEVTHHCSSIMSSMMARNKKDTGAFTIPCTIEMFKFEKALCDLESSGNLMPYSIFHQLRLGKPQPTIMRLLMSNRSIKKPMGILTNVLVKVNRFIFLADFVILDCTLDHKISIILERPLLATEKALVDIEYGKIKFCLNNEESSFNICKSMKQPMDLQVISIANTIYGEVKNYVNVSLVDDQLVGILWNCEREEIEDFDELVASLMGLVS
ncbi:uncharacterized protein LOC107856954 [Capsicum annuum]|uniref:uncharacterized protein LOC107856954 n=1 Tax=Capsicum annuum TaxID=4072 RepID=UPI0007BF92DC|nr:uncharacterized protein LOC107856954 [Capsicum annuum]